MEEIGRRFIADWGGVSKKMPLVVDLMHCFTIPRFSDFRVFSDTEYSCDSCSSKFLKIFGTKHERPSR